MKNMETIEAYESGMRAILDHAEKMAIEYDNNSLAWYQAWEETDETKELYHQLWKECNEKCYAMLRLLNECETCYNHYVLNGKIVRELVA